MAHPYWPLFDLEVRTPRLTLRAIDDRIATDLAALAAKGIHDSQRMPFGVEWTDAEPPQLQVNTMQYYWRCRAELTADAWTLDLAAFEGDVLVGTTGLIARQFPTTRAFETGSWLGRRFQGRGLGTEMRVAALHLGFDGFGARLATTAAFDDNLASLGVTRRLGYQPNGEEVRARRGRPARSLRFRMDVDAFGATVRRADIELSGVAACRPLLGIT